jgi:hypothetical protein
MKFGVATFFTGRGIGPSALAQALEERGFDSLFVTEHTHIPASRRTPYPAGGELPERYYRLFDPFLALTAAATVTFWPSTIGMRGYYPGCHCRSHRMTSRNAR